MKVEQNNDPANILAKAANHIRSGVQARFAKATGRFRSLPGLLIIGAQKSGTTSLHNWLSVHRQLVPASTKEVHYFDGGVDPKSDSFQLGPNWYRSHFPIQCALASDQIAFESSPRYLHHPECAGRIAHALPDAKLIAVLRNPTERAISHYFHEKRHGREPLGITEAFLQEENRLRSAIAAKRYQDPEFIHHSYKSRGLYCTQLERYLPHFNRGKLLVLNSSSMFADPHATLRRVFSFLGIDSRCEIPDPTAHNRATNRDEVDQQVFCNLQDYFKAPNRALYELIGEDFGW